MAAVANILINSFFIFENRIQSLIKVRIIQGIRINVVFVVKTTVLHQTVKSGFDTWFESAIEDVKPIEIGEDGYRIAAAIQKRYEDTFQRWPFTLLTTRATVTSKESTTRSGPLENGGYSSRPDWSRVRQRLLFIDLCS
jgi:hypothetical protein